MCEQRGLGKERNAELRGRRIEYGDKVRNKLLYSLLFQNMVELDIQVLGADTTRISLT